MAAYLTQLQPYEENQSPSPIEERSNPLEQLSLARSRSSGRGQNPPSPGNTLQRQLSGDPEAPPPAWTRRKTILNRTPSSRIGTGTGQTFSAVPVSPNPSSPVSPHSIQPRRSPSASDGHGQAAATRRHLAMTAANRAPLPNQAFPHDSPNSSSANLAELGLPQPAFRRASQHGRSPSSNRSSMNSLTSEDLWRLDQEANVPDLSNPTTPTMERPLDTVRRMSRRVDNSWSNNLPGEVIWPAAPADDFAHLRSKSTTNVPAKGKRLTISRKRSVQSANTIHITPAAVYAKSVPVSPINRTESLIISSANSSSTSLNSQAVKSPLLNRPPSAFYSRDFLTSLAPREGGYAIAATMGNGLGAAGAMSVEERRRSTIDARRAPVSRSAGMGRWSLDGGEHYSRPYGTPSANTTASNLSGPAITTSDESPPLETLLPEGAFQPTNAVRESVDAGSTAAAPPTSFPPNPSPLSQHTHADDLPAQGRSQIVQPSAGIPPVPPIPAELSAPNLNTKKSKKELAKEAKAAQKAETAKLAQQRAEAARQEQIKRDAARYEAARAKEAKKAADLKAKEDAKRKEKEDKARRKMEKKTGNVVGSASESRRGSMLSLPLGGKKVEEVPKVPSLPSSMASASTANSAPPPPKATPLPVPQPVKAVEPMRSAQQAPTQAQTQNRPPIKTVKSKMSLFGTIRRKLSGAQSEPINKQNVAATPPTRNAPPAPQPPAPVVSAASRNATPTGPHSQAGALPAGAASPATRSSPSLPPPVSDPPTMVTAPTPVGAGIPATEQPQSQSQPPPSRTHTPRASISASSPSSQSAPLTQSLSRDSYASSSPSRARANSIRGPRAMPAASLTSRNSPDFSRSRPQSVITTPSTEAAPTTPASFPFNPHSHPQLMSSTGTVVTPSTSAESSIFSPLPAQAKYATQHDGYELGLGPVQPADLANGSLPAHSGSTGPEREGSKESKASVETVVPGMITKDGMVQSTTPRPIAA